MTNDLDAPVVLDTGVVVSALLLPRSVPRRAFDHAFARSRVVASAATQLENLRDQEFHEV